MRYNDEDYGDGLVSYMVRDHERRGIYFRVSYQDILMWEKFVEFIRIPAKVSAHTVMSQAHEEMMQIAIYLQSEVM